MKPGPEPRVRAALAVALAALPLTLLAADAQQDASKGCAAPIEGITSTGTRMVDLQPGPPVDKPQIRNPYAGNVEAVNEGSKLFAAFNCSGCHSHGGGGMGPPLMDSQWIYGSDAANIFATIVEGRPNGMPSFGSKLPPDSIWKLATYVRSLSGLEPQVQPNFPIHGTPAAHTNDVPEALKKYYSEIESSP